MEVYPEGRTVRRKIDISPETDQTNRVCPLDQHSTQDSKPLDFGEGGSKIRQIKSPNNELLQSIPQRNSFMEEVLLHPVKISNFPETDQTNRVCPLVRPNNSCEATLPQDSKPLASEGGGGEGITQIKSPNNEVLNAPTCSPRPPQ
ncbi:hypothetical protein CEXT_806591 [Caerostris extrusa]|uniref:Prolactin receptor n=1 Tax=Caerostris extrusa TaxID=172846 RepID=A0AAV4UCI3_CAEEX|nr:hypothetical protein CEXT_806591 [Caerostris extrusa]